MEFQNYTTYNKAEDIKRLRFIVTNLPITNIGKLEVLEIGCGNGNISYQMARYGHNVTAIDISQTTIDNAIKNFGKTPNLTFKVADAQKLDLFDNKFDAIVCSEVLEHLEQPESLANNFKNLLKTDGIVIVTVPNGYGPRELFITKPMQSLIKNEGILGKVVLKIKYLLGYRGNTMQTSAEYLEHVQFFTLKKLRKLADKSGFKITKVRVGNFMETVFPFSLLTKRIYLLQKFDCFMADILPNSFSSIFYSVWVPKRD